MAVSDDTRPVGVEAMTTAWRVTKWLGRSYWGYRRSQRIARGALVATPIGVQLMRMAFARRSGQVIMRVRVHPGAGVAVRVLEPTPKRRRRDR